MSSNALVCDFFNADNYHRSLENRKQENNKSPLSLDNYFLKANGSKCSYLEKIKKRKCSKGITTPIISSHLGWNIQTVVALINKNIFVHNVIINLSVCMDANCVWQIVFLMVNFSCTFHPSCTLAIGLTWTDIPSLWFISTAQVKHVKKTHNEYEVIPLL